MGLATGVIGMVINLVAGMLWESPITMIFAVLVFVGGHVFNLAINALGAYVHSCRLQYIEFFSRFYEDGGPRVQAAEQPHQVRGTYSKRMPRNDSSPWGTYPTK